VPDNQACGDHTSGKLRCINDLLNNPVYSNESGWSVRQKATVSGLFNPSPDAAPVQVPGLMANFGRCGASNCRRALVSALLPLRTQKCPVFRGRGKLPLTNFLIHYSGFT